MICAEAVWSHPLRINHSTWLRLFCSCSSPIDQLVSAFPHSLTRDENELIWFSDLYIEDALVTLCINAEIKQITINHMTTYVYVFCLHVECCICFETVICLLATYYDMHFSLSLFFLQLKWVKCWPVEHCRSRGLLPFQPLPLPSASPSCTFLFTPSVCSFLKTRWSITNHNDHFGASCPPVSAKRSQSKPLKRNNNDSV